MKKFRGAGYNASRGTLVTICGRPAALVVLLFACAGCAERTVAEETEGDIRSTSERLIFGADDRKEYGEALGDPLLAPFAQRANSVPILVRAADVSCTGATCNLATSPWVMQKVIESGPLVPLCNGVRYRGEPQFGTSCSGFLVAPNKIATADHCISEVPCSGLKIVFGFVVAANGGAAPTSVPSADVYQCASVSAESAPEDWAILTLDRVVSGPRPPLNVARNSAVALNAALSIIGYPNGVPVKISPTGTVTGISDAVMFSHNVDAFNGNSGGPVFDSMGVVQGIHDKGPDSAEHFTGDPNGSGCLIAQTCNESGCPPTVGDTFSEAVRVTRLSNQIPLTPVLTSLVAQL